MTKKKENTIFYIVADCDVTKDNFNIKSFEEDGLDMIAIRTTLKEAIAEAEKSAQELLEDNQYPDTTTIFEIRPIKVVKIKTGIETLSI